MIADRTCRAVSFLSRLRFAAPTGYKTRQAQAHRAYRLRGQRTRAHLERCLMIIWDGAAQHKSRIVRDYFDSTDGAVQMAFLVWSSARPARNWYCR